MLAWEFVHEMCRNGNSAWGCMRWSMVHVWAVASAPAAWRQSCACMCVCAFKSFHIQPGTCTTNWPHEQLEL
eukprot:scaffold133269_cov19-Tisochrysis_lutea.AAC.1